MHIKKNDTVLVITGKDKGKKGKVLEVSPKGKVEEIAEMALDGIGECMHFIREPAYKCDCSKEKCEQILLSLNNDSLKKIVYEDEQADIVCGFCNRSYHFNKEELLEILRKK